MSNQFTAAIHSVHNTGLLIKHIRDITLLSMKQDTVNPI